ncbi:hypothetical protein IGJ01_002794 [Enterococcus sp. AZ089]
MKKREIKLNSVVNLKVSIEADLMLKEMDS